MSFRALSNTQMISYLVPPNTGEPVAAHERATENKLSPAPKGDIQKCHLLKMQDFHSNLHNILYSIILPCNIWQPIQVFVLSVDKILLLHIPSPQRQILLDLLIHLTLSLDHGFLPLSVQNPNLGCGHT